MISGEQRHDKRFFFSFDNLVGDWLNNLPCTVRSYENSCQSFAYSHRHGFISLCLRSHRCYLWNHWKEFLRYLVSDDYSSHSLTFVIASSAHWGYNISLIINNVSQGGEARKIPCSVTYTTWTNLIGHIACADPDGISVMKWCRMLVSMYLKYDFGSRD